MVVDLLTNNGSVVGATAIDTRTGEFIIIKARAVVLATAACSRVYNPETPQPWKYKFKYHWCPSSVSGDGWAMALLVGDSIGDFINKAVATVVDEDQAERLKQAAIAPLSIKDGTEPMELECSIRYAVDRYVGLYKAEGKLREGRRRLNSLRKVFLPQLMARNPHFLARCQETRNLMDVAELHVEATLNRKEIRGRYVRLDYPDRDPFLDDLLTFQRMANGKPVLKMKKLKPMKYSNDHKEER